MARQVRIAGLVRTANIVRRELAGPSSPGHLERLKQRVEQNLQQVKEILRSNRAGLRDLPAPSQRAVQFLESVEWSKADQPNASVPAPSPPMLAWRGLTAFLDRTYDRLASDLSDSEANAVRDEIARTSRQMELTIQRRSATPQSLSPATRAQRGWLAFFSDRENLSLYIKARQRANRLLNAAAAGARYYPPPLTIHFRAIRGIYKIRETPPGALLWLPTPMIAFTDAEFETLADRIYDRDPHAKRSILAAMTGDGYQAVHAEIEALGGIVEQARGAAHDLAASFDRVNATYFGGKMARPRLTWNATFTGRKFGHYDWILDTVMVSRTLDSPGVPEFVVDFLMFHELLHKFHGLHWVNGRGYAHTSEFQQDERKFARYAEAEAVLSKLARSVR